MSSPAGQANVSPSSYPTREKSVLPRGGGRAIVGRASFGVHRTRHSPRTSIREARARAAHDAFCSLEPFEGLFEIGDHIPSVLDTTREPHEFLPDPEPLPPRRRELAVRGGGRMDGKGIDVS